MTPIVKTEGIMTTHAHETPMNKKAFNSKDLILCKPSVFQYQCLLIGCSITIKKHKLKMCHWTFHKVLRKKSFEKLYEYYLLSH